MDEERLCFPQPNIKKEQEKKVSPLPFHKLNN